MDRDLNDDMNKLVRYSIICVDREHETVLEKLEETVVRDRMDESGFTAWIILEFVQRMMEGKVKAPREWEIDRPEGVTIKDGKLLSIYGDPRKFLRVPFQVVDRYPLERFRYEEKQIHVLRRIEETLEGQHKHPPVPPSGGPPPPPPAPPAPPSGSGGGGGGHYVPPISVPAPGPGQEAVIEIKTL